jgi:predicted lipoprotein with Yx(FWY)xxD motif
MSISGFTRVPAAAAMIAGLALAAAACGSSSSSGTAAPAVTPAAAAASSGSVAVKMASSSLGSVLEDSKGATLYAFTEDSKGKSSCTGGCASVWPPLTVAAGGHLAAASGIGKLSTITRPDGSKQVAINGHPLYTYAADTSPGQTRGQGVQGTWFVVSPSGALIKKTGATAATTAPSSAPSSSSSPAGGGSGGYGY